MTSRSATEEQWTGLVHRLHQHRSIDYAYRRATEFAERAKKQLATFPTSAERDALLALPDYVLARDR
jgi:geranylgeranyl pyrophosphate synthase